MGLRILQSASNKLYTKVAALVAAGERSPGGSTLYNSVVTDSSRLFEI